MARREALTALSLALTLGCRSTAAGGEGSAPAFSPDFEPPPSLETHRMRLEPLAERYVELDFEALMDSRDHLSSSLQWGDWPREGFTLEENREDLAQHYGEFERGEAYAYTVLAPDRSHCVGCIYLNPQEGGNGDPRLAFLSWWVIEEGLSNGLDRHLVTSVLSWIEREWPLDTVVFFPHREDTASIALLVELGLEGTASPSPDHLVYTWRRGE